MRALNLLKTEQSLKHESTICVVNAHDDGDDDVNNRAEVGSGRCHLTTIRRTFVSPISASSNEPLRVKRKHGFFAIRTERRGQVGIAISAPMLKESAEERRRFIRDADNLVRCLTIEFEVKLGLGSTVVPVGKRSELVPSQAPLRERGASDGDAHARRLPGDPAFFRDCVSQGDDAARDETRPAFVLAREDENRIAFGDVLATIHRLLRVERERVRRRIVNLGFDRKHHTAHLAPLISMAVHKSRPNETQDQRRRESGWTSSVAALERNRLQSVVRPKPYPFNPRYPKGKCSSHGSVNTRRVAISSHRLVRSWRVWRRRQRRTRE
jgi:hypothetical protein